MNARRRDALQMLVASLMFAVGAAGHAYGPTLPLMLALTPWMLLAFGLLSLHAAVRDQGGPVLAWTLAVAAATFFLEALGVATGLVFGSYEYGTALGAHVLGVPPVIGFNWALVVLGCVRFLKRRFPGLRPALGALAVGILAVGFDWIMEPLAIRLGYWAWAGGDIPLQNYAAWFAIAAVAAYPALRQPRRPDSAFPAAYVLIQAVFFVVLRAALSFR